MPDYLRQEPVIVTNPEVVVLTKEELNLFIQDWNSGRIYKYSSDWSLSTANLPSNSIMDWLRTQRSKLQ